MLEHNAEMAENVIGIPRDRIIVSDDGDILELMPDQTNTTGCGYHPSARRSALYTASPAFARRSPSDESKNAFCPSLRSGTVAPSAGSISSTADAAPQVAARMMARSVFTFRSLSC